jgi:hypothetical protein
MKTTSSSLQPRSSLVLRHGYAATMGDPTLPISARTIASMPSMPRGSRNYRRQSPRYRSERSASGLSPI